MTVLVIAAIIIAVFFAAGVVFGVTVIIWLSVGGRRRLDHTWPQHLDPRPSRPPGRGPGPDPGGVPGPDPGDGADTGCPDDPPHWPDSGHLP